MVSSIHQVSGEIVGCPVSQRLVPARTSNPIRSLVFVRDPAAESINRSKRLALVDGIRYQRIGDEEYYAQELFELEELTGHLKNMPDTTKLVYEQVVYDSAGVERTFAK